MPGDTLTIFSSLPLQGPHADQAQSIVNAQKLALREAGGKVGDFKVNFASADDATAGGDRVGWDPDKTAENARKAVENTRTIAYIGDFDSGATAVSLPITNEAGFVQVSPAATAVGLTKLVPGAAEAGEPDKFYPSGDRTFARVVPADDVQASAAARWARQLGARTVFVVGDKTLEGDGLVGAVPDRRPRTAGLRVVGQERMDPRAEDYRDLAREVRAARPDAVYFGGGAESNALRLWRDLHAALPRALLMGSARPARARASTAGSGRAERTHLHHLRRAGPEPAARRAARRFVRDYRREFGEAPDPYAAYGYAAMSLLLDAIERAGDEADERERVVERDARRPRTSTAPSARSRSTTTATPRSTAIAGYRVRDGRLGVRERAARPQPTRLAAVPSYRAAPARLRRATVVELARRARDAGAARLVRDRRGDRLRDVGGRRRSG